MRKVTIKKRVAQLSENFKISLRSIAATKLRSTLTIIIIAVGITALVGTLTTTAAIKSEMQSSFGKMGGLSFSIRSLRSAPTTAGLERRINENAITFQQAQLFTQSFDRASLTTIYTTVAASTKLSSGAITSNPTYSVMAVDQHYTEYMGALIREGRGFSNSDIERGQPIAIIGVNVARTLFKGGGAIDSHITFGSQKYRIIGVLDSMGDTFGGGVDSEMWIPISTARATLLPPGRGYSIGVKPFNDFDDSMAEAEQLLRSIRRLTPSDRTDFRVVKSSAFMEEIEKILSYVTVAAFIVGMITLLGAAVGLMNIMLVSVKERQREIGTRKAIGASSRAIGQQFIFESITVGLLGGAAGIVVGVVIGNLVASLLSNGAVFLFPWIWISGAVLLSLGVSLLSGYIPAKRASKLDPVVALRQQ